MQDDCSDGDRLLREITAMFLGARSLQTHCKYYYYSLTLRDYLVMASILRHARQTLQHRGGRKLEREV